MSLRVENGFSMVLTGGVETGTCLFLVRTLHAVPLDGIKVVCMEVIGYAWSNRWKISSTDSNGCQLTEWRWLLSEQGSLPTLRSL